MEIKARNVNWAFSEIFWRLKVMNLTPEPTRNGPALVIPEPVITTYTCPAERVLFHTGRDANPIFHLMESIWMLAGRRDVDFLTQFNSRMGEYSDNGSTFNAAYGYRWRHHFGFDQLLEVIKLLKLDPHTRQAVVQIWDHADLRKFTKDKACNTQIVFDTRGNRMNMTVFNRSNDAWWGAYGANAVHFSFLQEFVALAVGYRLGYYHQVSNNLHLYTEMYDASSYLASPPAAESYDLYSTCQVRPLPIMRDDNYRTFLDDCKRFCDSPYDEKVKYRHQFFTETANPMAQVSMIRRGRMGDGLFMAEKIKATDWRAATLSWIKRREDAKLAKFEAIGSARPIAENNLPSG